MIEPEIGVGQELKRLLRRFHIAACPACEQRSLVMDEAGVDWCRKHLDVIVGWLADGAREYRLPFCRPAAKLLVLWAIRNTRRKQRVLRSTGARQWSGPTV